MKISEVLDMVREKVKKHFEHGEVRSYEQDPSPENRYWVDVIVPGAFFKEVNSFLDELCSQLLVDKNEFMLWTSEELKDKIGIGFYLPYLRALSKDEVRAKYIYVEGDYKEYFPPIGGKLSITSKGNKYETHIDENSRLFLTQWFEDYPAGTGDIVSLWCVKWGSGEYVAETRRRSTKTT